MGTGILEWEDGYSQPTPTNNLLTSALVLHALRKLRHPPLLVLVPRTAADPQSVPRRGDDQTAQKHVAPNLHRGGRSDAHAAHRRQAVRLPLVRRPVLPVGEHVIAQDEKSPFPTPKSLRFHGPFEQPSGGCCATRPLENGASVQEVLSGSAAVLERARDGHALVRPLDHHLEKVEEVEGER
jgi:hypothetical protein